MASSADAALGVQLGGRAADGVDLAGGILLKLCSRSGLQACGQAPELGSPPSGRAVFRMMTGSERLHVPSDRCDLLVAFDLDACRGLAGDAARGVLFDSGRFQVEPGSLRPGAAALGLPCAGLQVEPRRWGMAALGALTRLMGLDLVVLDGLIREARRSQAAEATALDLLAARAGFEHAGKEFPPLCLGLRPGSPRRLALSGERAVALGALSSGCKFLAVCPGSLPSASTAWLAARAPSHGVVFRAAEDAPAAVHMAVGAGFAGVRAMAWVSGAAAAGFDEAVEFAAAAEIPVVLAAGGGAGAYRAREGLAAAVIVPGGVADAFHSAVEAFDLAERFQAPVVLLMDAGLEGRVETLDDLGMDAAIERGTWAVPQPERTGRAFFERYADSETGVSPRTVPGTEGLMFVAPAPSGLQGPPCAGEREVLLRRISAPAGGGSSDKSSRKLRSLAGGLKPMIMEGPLEAELTLVGSGSACAMMRCVMSRYNVGGARRVQALTVRYLHPFPADEVAAALKPARRVVAFESDPAGPLCRLIREGTGFEVARRCVEPGGGPLRPAACLAAVEEALHD
ncbi:MAG: hypothetical protein HY927_09045 [Elusimicrobia bacterium]|nr:hypothetical protein [Elusimicrobiota bacterium]